MDRPSDEQLLAGVLAGCLGLALLAGVLCLHADLPYLLPHV